MEVYLTNRHKVISNDGKKEGVPNKVISNDGKKEGVPKTPCHTTA